MKFRSLGLGILVIMAITLLVIAMPTSKSSGHFSTDAAKSGGYYIDHYPIRINNNTDFKNLAANDPYITGNGTESDPYIIDDLGIDATGNGSAIYIGNTTVYFIISNGTYQNAEAVNAYGIGAGIMLVNVQNGTIINNDIEKNGNMGIYIEHSSNIKIEGNTIKDNTWGVLLQSTIATVENNKIYNNSYTGIIISNSNNTYVSGNSLYGNPSSIELRDSTTNTIYNNTLDGANQESYGLLIENSTQNNILNNTIQGSRYGIYMHASSYNDILGNIIIRNSQYGIYVDAQSSNNRIYENEFFYNHGSSSTYDTAHVQALDNGTNNIWYSSNHRGNYWLDWAENNNTNDNNTDGIVDYPYPIDGSSGTKDLYPLKNASYTIPELNWYLILTPLLIIFLVKKLRK